MSSSQPPHHNLIPKRPLLPPKAPPATHKSYTIPLPSRLELQPPSTTSTSTTTTPPTPFHAAHPPQPFLDPSLLSKRRAAALEAQAAQERLSRASTGV
ncbi:hypothetical protein VF21_04043 [Pseudogymnoascus sp. 05NY08]|nr:hypothetical protein VF21_04043 [Pseudogymnoascus sp. 05NY08]